MSNKVGMVVGIGCLVVIGLVIAGGVGIYFAGKRAVEFTQQQIALEQERHQLITQWTPPADDVTPDGFFPQTVDGLAVATVDDKAAIAELQLDVSGMHATYGSQGSQMDVYAYKMTPLEKEAIFGRLDDLYEGQENGMKSKVNMGYRMYFSSSQYGEYNLWYSQGWLLVFKPQGVGDQEAFIFDFMTASSS